MPQGWPGAFFLTDSVRTPDPVSIVLALPPGVGVIYRHFGTADRLETAKALRAATFHARTLLLIANDPELALAVTADGVHWPEARAHVARKWKQRFRFQTQSAHSRRAISEATCDAVLFSSVFPSNSPSAGHPTGAIRFRLLAGESNALIYALGGVSGETAASVSRCAGLAAIEGFMP